MGVLGGLVVRWADDVVPVGHARQRSVLAALAVEPGRVVSADALVERVWGGRPPTTARAALRTYVAHLRRALAPCGVAITHRTGGYLLDVPPDAVDLHRFRALLAAAREHADPHHASGLAERALALWRGEPLAELDTPWAQAVRERSRLEHAAAEADRVDWALRCGRHHELLPELTARAETEPLDERVAGQLMRALYQSGRQADALRRYQHIRERLAEDLGADPGSALRRLHQDILTADPALTAPATTTGSPSVPRQLPAPPRWFTGRTEHLAALDTALDQRGGAVISVIGGAGGIGKTWLALTWAHRTLDRFPDGQLFVDLRGFSPDSEPVEPAAALRGFLDALGVPPDRLPVDTGAQAALYRSLVAGKRMLIVLDNAATADQVAPLLPGGDSCTVLVTSRHRLHGLIARHGARPLPLGVLTDTESHALLVAALGDEQGVTEDDHAAAELIALCGGFPLALGLIAARAQPDLPLPEVVAELRESGLDALDADDPTTSLPAVLSWSLRHLTDRHRTAFALLGIAPGPHVDLPTAAGLIGRPERETNAVLRALTDASLLDRRPGGRYAMHDLVRAYAATVADTLPEDVRDAALDRVVDCHLHTAFAADRLLYPHRRPIRLDPPAAGARAHPLPDYPAAIAWLDAHHTHLLAAQRLCATRHRHRAAWRLAWTLGTFHQRRGHRHDDLTAWEIAVDAATALADPAARALAHRFLGRAHADLGRHEQAVRHLHEALSLAEDNHDVTEQFLAHRGLAWIWERPGNHRRSLEHARHALDLCRTLDRPAWEADALNAVGWYAALAGEHGTARDHCEAALALHRRHDNPNGEASTLDSLGFIAHHTGRHHEAVDHYERSLALFRTLGNTTEAATILDHLGHPLAELGEVERARAVWREALELYREQGREADADRVRRQLDPLHDRG
ncbi:MAG: tetratricopeptide repeat protein [Saccharothrix sp.]|nr:tetratricopeptide repeat protein [Saccharothrix sp.]